MIIAPGQRPQAIILVAIKMEFLAVAAKVAPKVREYPAAIGSWDVWIRQIGLRAERLEEIDIPETCELIIMAGLAGGLDPKLNVGDVIVSGAPAWMHIPDDYISAPIATVDYAVTSIEAKAQLFEQTHAAAVDMETSVVRNWATQHGKDFLCIRAISDAADDVLDPRILRLVDNDGNPRPMQVGSYLAGNPLRIRGLMKLGRNSKRAAENLAKAVYHIIERLPPTRD